MVLTIPVFLLEKGRLNWEKKPNNIHSDFKGLPQNLDQTDKDGALVGVFSPLMKVMLPQKSFCYQKRLFTLGKEIWSEKFYSGKTTESFWASLQTAGRWQVAHSIGKEVSRSLALWACPAGTGCHCISACGRSRKQGRLLCTRSWLGLSPA